MYHSLLTSCLPPSLLRCSRSPISSPHPPPRPPLPLSFLLLLVVKRIPETVKKKSYVTHLPPCCVYSELQRLILSRPLFAPPLPLPPPPSPPPPLPLPPSSCKKDTRNSQKEVIRHPVACILFGAPAFDALCEVPVLTPRHRVEHVRYKFYK